MTPNDYTLDDLVRATGFSKRQIRFYITKRLVAGAGDRGPHAGYGEETLRRLKLIAALKDLPVAPTGRTMSLDEIGHAIDTLPEDDTAREFLARMRGGKPHLAEQSNPYGENSASRLPFDEFASAAPSLMASRAAFSPDRGGEDKDEDNDIDPIPDLLSRLQTTLAELGSDTRFTNTAKEGEQWLRITTPDVEFHVRKPDDHRARQRLTQMAQELGRMLAREE